MLVGKTGKRQIVEVAHVLMILRSQQFADLAALVIPRSSHRTRGRADHGAARSKRRFIEKALIGIHLGGRRVIDRHQTNLVDVVHLFHRFAKAQAEIASARAELRAVDLDPFIRVGVVFRRGRNPVANDRSANHVGDEFIFFSVPGKQRGAGTSPAVEFGDVERGLRAHLGFILGNTGRPQDPHQVGVLGGSQAGKKLLRSLAEVAGGSGNLKLLPDSVGKDFHLGADGRFVVGNAFHRDQQRVIAIAAYIAQQQRISRSAG